MYLHDSKIILNIIYIMLYMIYWHSNINHWKTHTHACTRENVAFLRKRQLRTLRKAVYIRMANLTLIVKPFKRIISYISLKPLWSYTIEFSMNYYIPLIFLPQSAEAYFVGAILAATSTLETSVKFVKIQVLVLFLSESPKYSTKKYSLYIHQCLVVRANIFSTITKVIYYICLSYKYV